MRRCCNKEGFIGSRSRVSFPSSLSTSFGLARVAYGTFSRAVASKVLLLIWLRRTREVGDVGDPELTGG